MQRSSIVADMSVWIPTDRTQVPLNNDGAECGRWKLDPAVRFYQRVETACYALLFLSGICTVLYSAVVLFR